MTKAISKYETENLEVKVYEDHSIRCIDDLGNKVYINQKINSDRKYDFTVFCSENPEASEEEVLDTVHESIDAYYEECKRAIAKDIRIGAESIIEKIFDDERTRGKERSRKCMRQVHSGHTKLYDFVSHKNRNPKAEIDMYQYYVERVAYGKTDEVLVATAKKFGKTVNSVRVLMNWYNHNFLYLYKHTHTLGKTTIEQNNVCRVSSARSAGDNRKQVLASIRAYRLNLQ